MECIKYTSKYKVELGIMAHNEVKYIRKTLDSIIDNYDYIDHIILSDNASDDGTTEICKEYADRYDKIDLYIHKEKLILEKQIKWIIRLGNSKYFQLIRVKDYIDKDYIKKCVEALDNYPECVAAVTDVIGFADNESLDLSYLYDFSKLKFIQSNNVLERVRIVLENHYETCQVNWCMCRYDVLLEGIMNTCNKKELGSDVVLGMYMAIAGPWVIVKDTRYNRFWRMENAEQVRNRYINQYGTVPLAHHTHWYLPLRFWTIIKDNYPDLCTQEFFELMLLYCSITYDAYWTDNEWYMHHTNKGINQFLRETIRGRDIIIFGANQDGLRIGKILSQAYKIECYVDNNLDLLPTNINEYPVFSTEYLNNYNKEESIIIVSSFTEKYSIIDQLLSLGFKHKDDFIVIPGEIMI